MADNSKFIQQCKMQIAVIWWIRYQDKITCASILLCWCFFSGGGSLKML